MCGNTGLCGTDVGRRLVIFAADVDWAKKTGAKVERFRLAQQPMTFAENATVKSFLERSGQEALPRLPVHGEMARWPAAIQSVPSCRAGPVRIEGVRARRAKRLAVVPLKAVKPVGIARLSSILE